MKNLTLLQNNIGVRNFVNILVCELRDRPSLDKLFQIILQHRMITGYRTQIEPNYPGTLDITCVTHSVLPGLVHYALKLFYRVPIRVPKVLLKFLNCS